MSDKVTPQRQRVGQAGDVTTTPQPTAVAGGTPPPASDVTPQNQKFPSPSSSASAPQQGSSLALWGMWECWCDIPLAVLKRNSSKKEQKAAQNQPWIDQVRSLGLFDTAHGFWGIHDCVVPPSRLPNGANFYLFRHNIPPMWEHEANRRGGKWVVAFSPDQGAEADEAWTKLSVALIGEQLPGNEEEVCGCSVAKRRSGIKVGLWTRNAHNPQAQKNIGFFLKVLLGLKASGSIKYLEHCAMFGAVAPGTTPSSPTVAFDSTSTPLRESSGNVVPQQGEKGRTSPVMEEPSPSTPTAVGAPVAPLYSL